MIDKNKILSCFTNLVGWRESAQAEDCFDELDVTLTNPDCPYFVNDLPAVSLNLVNEVIGDDECDVNSYLTNTHHQAILALLNKFVIMQKEKLNTKALLSHFNIGTKIGNIRTTTNKFDRFVGFEICQLASNSIKTELSHIGLQFNEIQTDLDIYFYSSSQLEPVKTFPITTTKASSLEWIPLTDFVLSYISENDAVGATYYIGYYESELTPTGKAVKTDLACGTCKGSPVRKYRDYVGISPISVASGHTYISRELFDVESISHTTESFGIHLKINVECDISDLLCKNKESFSSLLQKKIAIKILWDAYNSDAINRTTFINKEDSRLMAEKYELDLMEELETIVIDFSEIDSVCVPCKRRTLTSVNLR